MGIGANLIKIGGGDQDIALQTWDSVEWTAADFEVGGDFWDVSASTKLVIPAGLDGRHLVTFSIAPRNYTGKLQNNVGYRILVNGTKVIYQVGRFGAASSVRQPYTGFTFDEFSEGDELELQVFLASNDQNWRKIEDNYTYQHFSIHYVNNAPSEDCGVRAIRTSSFDPGVESVVTFESTDYDTDSFWSAGDPTKITIPSGKGGTYLVVASGDDTTGTGIRLYKNGSLFNGTFLMAGTLGGTYSGFMSPSAGVVLNCTAGDYYEMYVLKSLNTNASTTDLSFQRLETISS